MESPVIDNSQSIKPIPRPVIKKNSSIDLSSDESESEEESNHIELIVKNNETRPSIVVENTQEDATIPKNKMYLLGGLCILLIIVIVTFAQPDGRTPFAKNNTSTRNL